MASSRPKLEIEKASLELRSNSSGPFIDIDKDTPKSSFGDEANYFSSFPDDFATRSRGLRGAQRRGIFDLRQRLIVSFQQSNVLKIPLPAPKPIPLYSVNDLYVESNMDLLVLDVDIPIPKPISKADFMERDSRCKIIRGTSGIGKSTEMRYWIQQWCEDRGPLRRYKAVFYLDVEKMDDFKSINLGEAIMDQCMLNSNGAPGEIFRLEDVEKICQEEGDQVLVIIDAFNRSPPQALTSTSGGGIIQMLKLEAFTALNILIVTTPDRVHDFYDVYHRFHHAEIKGLNEDSVEMYISKVFKNTPERREFGKKLYNHLKDRGLTQDLTSLPILLANLCQCAKWADDPTELHDMDTSRNLVEKMIICMMKHTALNRSPSALLGHSAEEGGSIHCTSDVTSDVGPVFPYSHSSPNPNPRSFDDSFLLQQLGDVAYRCYLGYCGVTGRWIMQTEFPLVGVERDRLIRQACDKGLLIGSDDECINPSHHGPAKGYIFQFVIPIVQQFLAAKHFARLLEGNGQEKELFIKGLHTIQNIPDAERLGGFLKFTCGFSIEAAEEIVKHVSGMVLERPHQQSDQESISGGAHSRMRKDEERQLALSMCLEFNYESNSGGALNDVLQPMISQMHVCCTTAYSMKVTKYLLQHAYLQDANQTCLDLTGLRLYGMVRDLKRILSPLQAHLDFTRLHQNENEDLRTVIVRAKPTKACRDKHQLQHCDTSTQMNFEIEEGTTSDLINFNDEAAEILHDTAPSTLERLVAEDDISSNVPDDIGGVPQVQHYLPLSQPGELIPYEAKGASLCTTEERTTSDLINFTDDAAAVMQCAPPPSPPQLKGPMFDQAKGQSNSVQVSSGYQTQQVADSHLDDTFEGSGNMANEKNTSGAIVKEEMDTSGHVTKNESKIHQHARPSLPDRLKSGDAQGLSDCSAFTSGYQTREVSEPHQDDELQGSAHDMNSSVAIGTEDQSSRRPSSGYGTRTESAPLDNVSARTPDISSKANEDVCSLVQSATLQDNAEGVFAHIFKSPRCAKFDTGDQSKAHDGATSQPQRDLSQHPEPRKTEGGGGAGGAKKMTASGDEQNILAADEDYTEAVEPEHEEIKPKLKIKKIPYDSISQMEHIADGSYNTQVFKGKCEGHGTVAIKEVPIDENKVARKHIEREIKVNAKLDHSNIVKLLCYAVFQRSPMALLRYYLVMEFIEGETLERSIFVTKTRYMGSPAGKMAVSRKLCDAVAYIHQKNCTHSDLKPNNILIRLEDNEPLICDMGLAHMFTSSSISQSTEGVRKGVPRFKPPEAYQKDCKVNSEWDIWSLACVLCEVITGVKVWGKFDQDLRIMCRLCNSKNVVPKEEIRLIESGEIRKVLRRCFTKDIEARPSARNLLNVFTREEQKLSRREREKKAMQVQGETAEKQSDELTTGQSRDDCGVKEEKPVDKREKDREGVDVCAATANIDGDDDDQDSDDNDKQDNAAGHDNDVDADDDDVDAADKDNDDDDDDDDQENDYDDDNDDDQDNDDDDDNDDHENAAAADDDDADDDDGFN